MSKLFALPAIVLSIFPCLAFAQAEQEEGQSTEPVSDELLFTQAELENLVAPVALFPDTLLIQILVASSNPMEVVKADRLLAVSADDEPESVQTAIEAEGWDESVEVLAVAFPEVIEDMALHIEWTETMGDAMIAQTDDVMAAVQTMRMQAVNAGSLVSNDAQEVEVTDEEAVVVTPADPQVVYVPQYDPEVVYANNSNPLGDALTTGLVTYATFTVLDAIFDDDDDWDDYWGCRNCAGWGGGPIYRNPDIDIDIDGNVNIGNEIDLGDRDVNIGDRRPEDGWNPDRTSQDKARDKIANKRDETGKSKLPVSKTDSRSDALRSKLSNQSGAPDISRPEFSNKPDAIRNTMGDRKLPEIDRTKRAKIDKSSAGNLNRPKASKAVAKKSSKPAVKKPSASKKHVSKAPKAAPKKRPKATKKHSSAPKARDASKRGKKSGGKMKRKG